MMTNYPTSVDTNTELHLVADNIDLVEAVHHNALKDAIIAVQSALGITGAFNFTTDAEMSTHAGLDTGVHGSGGDTLATDADITTHAGLSNTHGVAQVANHAEIASQIGTHAALTNTHGVAQVANHAEIATQISTHAGDDNAHHEVFENLVEDATPQLVSQGELDMNNGVLNLNLTTVSNGYATGIACEMYNNSGSQAVYGDFVFVNGTSGGRAAFGNSDADSSATMPIVGMVLDPAINNLAVGKILLYGLVYHSSWNWSVGAGIANVLYGGTVANTLQQNSPSGNNDISQACGLVIHADKILFNPSYTTVQVVV